MAWYQATRHITHGNKACNVGDVVELDENEPKSDGFVLCDPPGGASKAEPKAKSKKADKAEVEPTPALVPEPEKKHGSWFHSDKKHSE